MSDPPNQTLVVERFDTEEEAQAQLKQLQDAGYIYVYVLHPQTMEY